MKAKVPRYMLGALLVSSGVLGFALQGLFAASPPWMAGPPVYPLTAILVATVSAVIVYGLTLSGASKDKVR